MLYTAESITPKHPDKVCDRISDAILDECLKQDKDSRVAIETLGGHNIITITGELTTNAFVDIRSIVNRIVGNNRYGTQINIVKQSPEIGRGVDVGGAGDQGIMVGHATLDNQEMMPQEFYLARSLCKFIYNKYKEDGKTQVTIEKDEQAFTKVSVVLASFNNVTAEVLKEEINLWAKEKDVSLEGTQILANPAGDWSLGSFDADAGVTGRKIVADAYGPRVSVGGGAYSGKDPSKVDRSGAYYARYLAKKILKEKSKDSFVHSVTVKLAFAIGIKEAVMDDVTMFDENDELISNTTVRDMLGKKSILVKDMIEELDLKNQKYEETAEWGAYGNGFIWDK